MKAVITIEDTREGVAVTCHCEEGGKPSSTRMMFELILFAVMKRFKPVKTHFVPIRKERKPR